MKFYYSAQQASHAPAQFLLRGKPAPSPERPERADMLQQAISAAGQVTTEPDHWDTPQLRQRLKQIHTARYLTFLETIADEWQQLPGASQSVTPNAHPYGMAGHYPRHPVGRAGWHMYDMAAPLTPDSFAGIMASAASAQSAAQAVVDGDACSYALCRPPGHHAGSENAGGYCFLNNSALAATVLREHYARVAIIDVDVHHGNGTQEIFWQRNDVWTASIHADPNDYYPFFWGASTETGAGEGAGFNYNYPLPVGASGAAFLAALEELLDQLTQFAPDAIVIALGLDAHKDDPLAGMTLETDDFMQIGRRLSGLNLPTAIIQEGGYPTDSLAANLGAFLAGYLDHSTDP